ncbi:phosphoribosylformylglycinamidine cyclo-ligase [Veillonella sp. CHU740]|uniref:phosphoribosylformylglycinamidine cyclo-ligase n=1 Tax=Veillonella sp. CHU740 TaxID=2490950 RepID=UPI000F8CC13D|nr:phosphoribosylformylglycinamidine cyclo-ligase [Veillonella sp. CHU740]
MTYNEKPVTYLDAGVDVESGNQLIQKIKHRVERTYTPGVLGSLGGFSGLFSLANHSMKEPVLVSSTDGVGTKIRFAVLMNEHHQIGQDCVAMSVNDVVAQGAKPLFFLDYIAVGKLNHNHIESLISGISDACEDCGCALIGGETSEMSSFYGDGNYDVAGFAVGIVDKEQCITGETIEVGDIVLGLPSSGLHSNGFSLVRHIILERKQLPLDTYIDELGRTIGEEVLEPTKLYVKQILPLVEAGYVKGMAHITGGSFYDNIPRILPRGMAVTINSNAWPVLPIFKLLQIWGNVEPKEMYHTFNMGIGMVLVVKPEVVESIVALLHEQGEVVYSIGIVTEGDGEVTIVGETFHA